MNEAKFNAIKEALKYIKDGQIIGLGSGSTVELFIEELRKKIAEEGIYLGFVPASSMTYLKLATLGLRIESLDSYPELDISFDGADEVDERKFALKGRGAALFREKILSKYSKKYIIMVEDSKLSHKIGEKAKVSIEVLPFATRPVMARLKAMGANVELRNGERIKDGPIISDNGNYILDASFGIIEDPKKLAQEINEITGVIENGIFYENISEIIVGTKDSFKKIV
ncbi:MAG TPA: ribose 5-phosphate isomerase A [Geobacterales bacterium]|nr:ribose 5-phosphate isomerase A [Geobacterales bacterium]